MHQNPVPGGYTYSREAIKVKVKKCEGVHQPEYRKFSVDPQITSFEVLQSILAKAFDIKGEFSVCYKTFDDYGQETYLSLLSDWDLDAAFLSASEPCLSLQVDLKPFEESSEDWDLLGSIDLPRTQVVTTATMATENNKQAPHARLPGLIYNQMERTINMFQRALNLVDGDNPTPNNTLTGNQQNQPLGLTYPSPPLAAAILLQEPPLPPRPPLTDAEFRQFLDPIGQVTDMQELRNVIYHAGMEPSLRKVVWKHILNVYPEGMSGKERMDYMKRKTYEYQSLRDTWREMVKNGQMVGELAYVTNMVRKDVLRTDRHHKFYAGNDDNQNIAGLFNILTTYAVNHPSVSYCQGMSDLASPLLVTMADEAHAYICFCALMRRLKPNFLLDGIMMTLRFQHLAEALLYYDPELYAYLKSHQADDLLFCYRWLLLEMKREFAFDDALLMLEVLWSSLPPPQPPEPLPSLTQGGLPLFETRFGGDTCPLSSTTTSATESPTLTSTCSSKIHTPIRENAYAKVCALRRQSSGSWSSGSICSTGRRLQHSSLDEASLLRGSPAHSAKPFASLDETDPASRSSNRVVRNLNEFKNFASPQTTNLKEEIIKKSPPPRPPPPKIASFNREDSSPDDPAEYFPMTTSMTRELRLDLENLDRQVFGSNAGSGTGDSIVSSGGIFLWENPLRETSPMTPEEQTSLNPNTEDGGEIFEPDENADGGGVKSVTPIRVVRNATSSMITTTNNITSASNVIKNGTTPTAPLPRTPSPPPSSLPSNSSISIISTPPASLASFGGPLPLPSPREFGGGNPFLMFLCLTVLLQHREVVMRGRLDYNEMAMHFDKMVRRHDVHRVLRQARAMHASYLRHFDDGSTPTLAISSASSNRNPNV